MKILRHLTCVALLLACATAFATPADPDLAGVHLGMSAEQAKSALHSFDATLAVKEDERWKARPNVPASVARIVANGPHDEIAVYVTQISGKVYSISRRHTEYGHNLQSDVVQAITNRLGPSSTKSDLSRGFSAQWYFDSTGNLQVAAPGAYNRFGQCQQGDHTHPPTQTLAFCGNVFTAVALTATDPSLNSTYDITISSHNLLRDEISLSNKAADAARASAEEQAAHTAKPKL